MTWRTESAADLFAQTAHVRRGSAEGVDEDVPYKHTAPGSNSTQILKGAGFGRSAFTVIDTQAVKWLVGL